MQDLEKVIYSSLRPEPVNAADLAVNLMEPVRLPQYPGFTVFVDLNPMVNHQQKFAVRKVLTAGSGLGLVSHVGEYPSIYLIRRELHEYLLKVSGDEHDRGRRPDPALSIPQLDPAASQARSFLAHYSRVSAPSRQVRGPMGRGYPGDDAINVTPQQAYLPNGNAGAPVRALPGMSPGMSNGSSQEARTPWAPPATGMGQVSLDQGAVNRPANDSDAPRGYHPNPSNSRADDTNWSQESDFDQRFQPSAADLVAKFTDPLGLSKGDYDLLTTGGLETEITNAVYAVHEVAKSDKILGDRLRKIDQTKHGVINMVAQRHAATEELKDELVSHLPSLVLFGTKGYAHVVDTLISQMEGPGGEGKLSLSEDQRYQHLKVHQTEIERLWRMDRRSATVWHQMTSSILKLAHGLAHLRAAEDAEERGRQSVQYQGPPGHG